jgi:hypothetical protein
MEGVPVSPSPPRCKTAGAWRWPHISSRAEVKRKSCSIILAPYKPSAGSSGRAV